MAEIVGAIASLLALCEVASGTLKRIAEIRPGTNRDQCPPGERDVPLRLDKSRVAKSIKGRGQQNRPSPSSH